MFLGYKENQPIDPVAGFKDRGTGGELAHLEIGRKAVPSLFSTMLVFYLWQYITTLGQDDLLLGLKL